MSTNFTISDSDLDFPRGALWEQNCGRSITARPRLGPKALRIWTKRVKSRKQAIAIGLFRSSQVGRESASEEKIKTAVGVNSRRTSRCWRKESRRGLANLLL
jgi:hypothetical protein